MPGPTVLCPCCGKRLVCSSPPEPGQAMRCHGCGRGFTVPGKSADKVPAVSPQRFPMMAVGICVGVALLTGAGVVLAMAYFGQPGVTAAVAEAAPTNAAIEAPKPDAPRPAFPPPPVQGVTAINVEMVPPEPKPEEPVPGPAAEPMPIMPEMPEPAPLPQDALVKDWLPKKEQAIVNEAIKRGVYFLKKNQFPNGSWGKSHPVGTTALPALALLECGVPVTDTSIRRAANFVRKSVPSLDRTYEISLAILFLDRLRAAEDRPRIVTLSQRLLAGQQDDGGWSYTCPMLNRTEEANLLIALRATRPISPEDLFVRTSGMPLLDIYLPKETSSKSLKLTLEEQNPTPSSKMVEIALAGVTSEPRAGADEGARPPEPEGPPPPPGPGNKPEKPLPAGKPEVLAPEVRRALDKLPERLRRIPALTTAASFQKRSTDMRGRVLHAHTDNSNTQFAIIGLWASRRHHVPMDRALALIVWRFHSSQHTDGSWQYHFVPTRTDGTGRATMTGAALIGLGVGYGLSLPNGAPRERGMPENPPLVDGLKSLGDSLANDDGRGRGGLKRARGGVDLYYWWTVERVAVLYGLRSFQGRPWYEAGVAEVIPAQKPDGSWMYHGGSPQPVGTSFALLFLKGSNLVSDLSQTIKGEAVKK
jgi:hypothetical protein